MGGKGKGGYNAAEGSGGGEGGEGRESEREQNIKLMTAVTQLRK